MSGTTENRGKAHNCPAAGKGPGKGRDLSTMTRFRRAKSVLKMMAKDLKDRSKVDELTVTVVEKGEPREWTSKWSGAGGRVCDAVGEDESGDKVNLTLWNDDIDKVEVNSKIRITNGWASSFKNKLQVSAGKYGKLEVL
jgi:ssDNA-binding replication factor A large subunit